MPLFGRVPKGPKTWRPDLSQSQVKLGNRLH